MIEFLKDFTVKLSNKINRFVEKIVIAFVFILFVIVMVQICFRYIFSIGFPWIDEISRFLNIWIALLGASIGMRYGDHVGVAFFMNLLPEKITKIFKFITRIITVILLAFVSKYAYLYFMVSTSKSPSLRLSYKWPKAAIFVGFTIMLIHLIRFILEDIVDLKNKKFTTIKNSGRTIANIEEK